MAEAVGMGSSSSSPLALAVAAKGRAAAASITMGHWGPWGLQWWMEFTKALLGWSR